MSAPRLTSLFPSLFRTTPLIARRTCVRQRPPTSVCSPACFHSSVIRRNPDRPERYGTAKPPPAHLKGDEDGGDGSKTKSEDSGPEIPEEMLLSQKNNYTALPAPSQINAEQPQSPPASSSSTPQDAVDKDAGSSKPLDTVLDMPPPGEAEDDNPPHLQAPRYVHHFDTWSLVRDLDKGGFKEGESITLMKAVRQSLADNMELARRALVSKSNVENVRLRTSSCSYNSLIAYFLVFRKHIYSAQLVPSSRPTYKTIAKRRLTSGEVNVPNCSTKWRYWVRR